MTPTSLAILADQFDSFIIDVWGVLHDGQAPYSGAVEALRFLKAQHKTICLLSNAPKRVHKLTVMLEQLGFDSSLYDHALTSGEASYRYLEQQDYRKLYFIGPQWERDIIDGLSCQLTNDAQQADAALLIGLNDFNDTLESKVPDLKACLASELPMICANPDRIVVRQDGSQMICAGQLAHWYETHGGMVIYIGKPYPEIYQQAIALLESQGAEKSSISATNDTSRICAIGDGVHTDIAGANEHNIHAVLITGGILHDQNADALPALCAVENAYPDAVMPRFSREGGAD